MERFITKIRTCFKMEPNKAELSAGKNSLEATVNGAIAGLIMGGIAGAATKLTNLDLGHSEFLIAGISGAVGLSNGISAEYKLRDYLFCAVSANVCYRIGYYGTRIVYDMFR